LHRPITEIASIHPQAKKPMPMSSSVEPVRMEASSGEAPNPDTEAVIVIDRTLRPASAASPPGLTGVGLSNHRSSSELDAPPFWALTVRRKRNQKTVANQHGMPRIFAQPR
jgi:hypothetical protein